MAIQEYHCLLSGDRLFSSAFAVEVEGPLLVVRGSMEAGMDALALTDACSSESCAVPPSVVDVVDWAGLRRIELDRAAFIKRWQRYVSALQRRLPEAKAEQLALSSLLVAKQLLRTFDELEFLCGASGESCSVLVVLHYREDALTPHLYFLREGVEGFETATNVDASSR